MKKIIFIFYFRYKDGTVKLRNRNIELMDRDVLYHLGLDNGTHDLVKMFGDVKVFYNFSLLKIKKRSFTLFILLNER